MPAAAAEGALGAKTWFVAVRQGPYRVDAAPTGLDVRVWRQGEDLEVELSGFRDFTRHCLGGGSMDNLDLSVRTPDVEQILCNGAEGKPFGEAKTCYSTIFHDDRRVDRRVRFDFYLTFLSSSEIRYEIMGRCFQIVGTSWLY